MPLIGEREGKLSAGTIRRNHRSAELLISTGSGERERHPSNVSRRKRIKVSRWSTSLFLLSSLSLSLPTDSLGADTGVEASSQPTSSSLPSSIEEIPIIHDETQIESLRERRWKRKKKEKKRREKKEKEEEGGKGGKKEEREIEWKKRWTAARWMEEGEGWRNGRRKLESFRDEG